MIRKTFVEALGALLLTACVVGSGIMAERLSPANMGVALLANAIATGCMLFVLISVGSMTTKTTRNMCGTLGP